MRWRTLSRICAGTTLAILLFPTISLAVFDSRVVTSPEGLPDAQFDYSVAAYGDVSADGSLVDGQMSAGVHSVVWDGKDSHGRAVASGAYIYRLRSNEGVETRRMTLLR